MKVHCINILLFAVPLNILAYTHKKPSITSRHIQNTRLLCECELYMPNYDNDLEMKRVMQKFHDRTTQRFQEYDEKLQEKRQIYKDKCDKEIQKIILKDKLEKELTEKFAILQTDIHSDAIPTCICEKSLADKVEKGCLRCGSILGAAMPEVGSIGATALYTLCQWQTKAIATAIEKAMVQGAAEGLAAGIQAGKVVAIKSLEKLGVQQFWTGMSNYILKMSHYNEVANLTAVMYTHKFNACKDATEAFLDKCNAFDINIGVYTADGRNAVVPREALPKVLKAIVSKAETTAKAAAEAKSTTVAAEITEQQTAVINATYTSICEKSLADKVEKNCLRCGGILGSAMPQLGLIGGSALYVAAVKSSVELGIKMGMQTVISDLKGLWGLNKLIDAKVIEKFVTPINYCNKTSIIEFLNKIYSNSCASKSSKLELFCNTVPIRGVEGLAARGAGIAEQAHSIGAHYESEKFAEMTSVGTIFSDPVIISAIVVVTIAVILLIIYLILRYQRKKKMKKKLQYIKLLNQ
ncbi:hypothetical protein PFTANZ_00175 [Plasmodium falciparum Tanzania (2000708)]|uniref:Surface antigen n=1 Tax=Plasmodium falciparum Tanzania (2000708) TaxID=1036725 RepID=A0A024WES3_PLAFA|nr:hypothetical protein PFTANZ_00175 [Plasmodium falciparum Tanzania (2000708)]